MSEMLANQYFLVRRFHDAEQAFENVLATGLSSKTVRKKLIICYIYNGKVRKAMEMFLGLIKEDINFIINTDIIADDCPCPELIENFEKKKNPNYSYINMMEIYGMLWLYCDINKSITFFEKLKEYNPSENIYKDILNIYSSYILEKIRS
jgi:tetratricopeptide (TPR) repeat protein